MTCANFGFGARGGNLTETYRPDRSERSFAAIKVLPSTRVGGRTLSLDALPMAAWVGVRGRIGSRGGPRDSVWDRRDVLGVRPQITRHAGRSGRCWTDRS